MGHRVGRNDPCPCGSGKKYKKCCLKKLATHEALPRAASENRAGGGFRFDPGAYGHRDRGFVPGILCRKRVGEDWQPHFLLANPATPFDSWVQAAEMATTNLDDAYGQKAAGGSDEAAAHRLNSLGYKSIEGFQIEDFRSIDLVSNPDLEPTSPLLSEPDNDSPNHPRSAYLNVVEEQIRLGEPPETARTFKRLTDSGHSEEEAKELIAVLVAAEIYALMTEDRGFDQVGYESNLRRLPELPDGLR